MRGRHDDLLDRGPRQAPEPETAEERSRKLGLKTAGGAVVVGGGAVAKAGILGGVGKFFLWAALWNLMVHGGWIALAVLLALVLAWFVQHRRRQA